MSNWPVGLADVLWLESQMLENKQSCKAWPGAAVRVGKVDERQILHCVYL